MNGLTPVCISSCSLSALERVNNCPHLSQMNGLTPECICSCLLRFLRNENDFPQASQVNGFTIGCGFSRPLMSFDDVPHVLSMDCPYLIRTIRTRWHVCLLALCAVAVTIHDKRDVNMLSTIHSADAVLRVVRGFQLNLTSAKRAHRLRDYYYPFNYYYKYGIGGLLN